MQQTELWHDNVYEALKAAVAACGGPKKVGGLLFPAKDETTATTRVRSGVNPEHAQELSPPEVILIAARAKEKGDHSYMLHLGQVLGYEVSPIAPGNVSRNDTKARIRELLAGAAELSEKFP